MSRIASIFGAIAWLAVAAAEAPCQTFPLDTLLANGPPEDRINLVFLAEGYRDTEMTKFRADVQGILDGLLAEPPLSAYTQLFNAYALEVPSLESGTDHPGVATDEPGGLPVFFRNTYFNSTFDASFTHRALVADNQTVFDVLQNNFPMWDAVFVIVNTDWYGGTGGTFSVFSTHQASTEIALHEMGHSYGDLADEYEYGNWPGYESPNTTSQTDRATIRWRAWIEPDTPVPTPETSTYGSVIGLFEGAVYNPTGWYRPKLNCKMQALGIPFCEVCREQMVKSTYLRLGILDHIDPESTSLVIPWDSSARFEVFPRTITPNTFAVKWIVNNDSVAFGTVFTFQAEAFDTGLFVVQSWVKDTTTWVRSDSGGILRTARQWLVRVLPPPYYVGDANGDRVITSADVILLVNFVFKGGVPPLPEPAGDVDCSGAISSADIIRLVNYIFKSGQKPRC